MIILGKKHTEHLLKNRTCFFPSLQIWQNFLKICCDFSSLTSRIHWSVWEVEIKIYKEEEEENDDENQKISLMWRK